MHADVEKTPTFIENGPVLPDSSHVQSAWRMEAFLSQLGRGSAQPQHTAVAIKALSQ